MKSIQCIYKNIYMQIWLLILSALIMTFGILMLTDLNNFTYGLDNKTWSRKHLNDENGKVYCNIDIDTRVVLKYKTSNGSFIVPESSGYKLDADLYLDIYYVLGGSEGRILMETVKGGVYRDKTYDLNYTLRMDIIPRIENVKITYPKWRIYVPIILLVLSVPMVGLSVYNIVCMIVENIRAKRESEIPADE